MDKINQQNILNNQVEPIPQPTNDQPQTNFEETPISVLMQKPFSIKKFMVSREGWVFGCSILVSFYMGYIYGFMMIISFYLGAYVAQWVTKRNFINSKIIKVIAWLNLVTWLLEFNFFNFGLFTSNFTDKIANNDPNNKKKYKTLATISYVLSIIVSVGIWFFSTSIKNMEKYGHK